MPTRTISLEIDHDRSLEDLASLLRALLAAVDAHTGLEGRETRFATARDLAPTALVAASTVALSAQPLQPRTWGTSAPRRVEPVPRPIQREVPEPDQLKELAGVSKLIRVHNARDQFQVWGDSLTVAVLDTGLNVDHIDFKGRIAGGRNFCDEGAADDIRDLQGHGTHVAGIVAADGDHVGIAPAANVYALKVLGNDGDGAFAAVEAALQWILDNHLDQGISVAVMAMADGENYQDDASFVGDPIKVKIRQLRALGIPVVISAGNRYALHGSTQGLAYPAIVRECIAVGAVYDDDVGMRDYPGYGARAYATAADRLTPFSQRLHASLNPDSHARIFAPGAPVKSTGIGGTRGESVDEGTSQAAPVIAGIILLMQEYYQRFIGAAVLPPVDLLVDCLRRGAVDIVDGDDERDNVLHSGLTFKRVDAVGALRQLDQALRKLYPQVAHKP